MKRFRSLGKYFMANQKASSEAHHPETISDASAMRRHKSIAKVAMGRRLGVRLYWMWRNGRAYSPSMEFGSFAGQLGIGHGVN
jgi:hypothetical protein